MRGVRLPPVRRASAKGRAARRRARRGHRAARRRDLPRDGRRRGLDHAPEARGRGEPTFKLPAAMVLGERLADVPEAPLAPDAARRLPDLAADPLRGARRRRLPALSRSTTARWARAQCAALRDGLRRARERGRRACIVLMGGPDFWSNGIHLNLIEASAHPAEESWRNINAMDDLVREIIADRPPADGRRDAGQRRRRRRVPGARRRPRLRPRRRRSSTRTTRAWATSTAPSTGPTCCRAASAPTPAAAITAEPPAGRARGRRRRSGLIDDHFGATPAAFRGRGRGPGRTRWPPIPRFDGLLAGEARPPARRRGGEAAGSATAPRSSSG